MKLHLQEVINEDVLNYKFDNLKTEIVKFLKYNEPYGIFLDMHHNKF